MSDLNSTALHETILRAGFTVKGEESIIAASLNSSTLLALIMGTYTAILGGTMDLSPNNLTAFSVQWYGTLGLWGEFSRRRVDVGLSSGMGWGWARDGQGMGWGWVGDGQGMGKGWARDGLGMA
ncbi:hypothetical protein BDN70DRAFT_899354 [Pholiota conissans]|uniref:Uncharacterized protein n=1 Tax=Pholiota conissans TaxID=109636 RepID=A0A9P5YRW4_9AGAR|nr:hypothetical protein BDN70DRAFT_899354 [Pholiota conissans]